MSHVPPALFTAMGVDQTMLLETSFLYELYIIDWKKQHEITASDERELAIAWHNAHKGSSFSWSPGWHGNALLELDMVQKDAMLAIMNFASMRCAIRST